MTTPTPEELVELAERRFKVIKEFRGPYAVLDLGADYPAMPAKVLGTFPSKRTAEAFKARASQENS